MLEAANRIDELLDGLHTVATRWRAGHDGEIYAPIARLDPADAAAPPIRVATAVYEDVVNWIVRIGPPVGRPLAAWLRSAAEDAVEIGPDHHAVSLAGAILGDHDD